MATGRIDSFYDTGKILGEQKQMEEALKRTLGLMKQIQSGIKSTTAASSGSGTRKEIDALTKAAEALKKSIGENAVLLQAYRAQISQNNTANRNEAKAIGLVGGAYDKLSGQLEVARKEFRDLAAAEKANTDQGKALLKNIQEMDAKIKQIDASMGNHQRNVGNYKSAWNGLNVSVSQIARELPAFAVSANTGILAISNNVPMLKDEIDKLIQKNKELKAEGKPTQSILKQLSGAVFSWNTAISIGVTLLTVYGKQISEWLKDALSAKKGADNLGSSLKELAGNSSETAKEFKELGYDSMAILEKATESLTDEIKGLNRELGITTVTAADKAKAAMKDLAVEQKKLQAEAKQLREQAFKSSGPNSQDALIIAAEASSKQALKIEKKLTESRLLLAEYEAKEETKRQQEADERQLELTKNLASDKIRVEKDAAERIINNDKASLRDKVGALASSYVAELALIDVEERRILLSLKSSNEDRKEAASRASADRIIAEKEYQERVKKLRDEYNKKQLDATNEIDKLLLEAQIDTWQKILEREENGAGIRLQASKYYFDNKKLLIELEEKIELEKATTSEQRRLANVRAEIALTNLIVETSGQRRKIIKQELEAEKELEAEYRKFFAEWPEKFRESVKDQEQNRFGKNFFLNEKELTDQLTSISEAFLKEYRLAGNNEEKKQKLYEKYQADKAALQNEFARREIATQMTVLNSIISILKAQGVSTEEEEKKLFELTQKYENLKVDEVIDAEGKKRKARKASLDEQLEEFQLIGEGYQALSTMISGLVNATYDQKKNAIQDEIDLITERTDREIQAIRNSTKTEQEKADAIAIINASAQARKEALELKQRKLDQQRARFERSLAIAQIITNTALAIVKAIAEGGPLGVAKIALAAATGAAQLAVVLATPIPQFAKGTDSSPEGYAIVGEKGAEGRIDPGGKFSLTPSKPTLTWLEKGTRIIPNNDLMEKLPQLAMEQPFYNIAKDDAVQFDMSTKIVSALSQVESAIKNKQETHWTLTPDGFKAAIKKGSSWFTYLNRGGWKQ